MVGGERLELSYPCGCYHLKVVRLPISPSAHHVERKVRDPIISTAEQRYQRSVRRASRNLHGHILPNDYGFPQDLEPPG